MRAWDLNTGASILEDALKTLQTARSETAEAWDDETNRKFQEEYLAPLEPRVRRVVDAIRRLADVMVRAQRDCDSY
jgi:hypothetical protein